MYQLFGNDVNRMKVAMTTNLENKFQQESAEEE